MAHEEKLGKHLIHGNESVYIVCLSVIVNGNKWLSCLLSVSINLPQFCKSDFLANKLLLQ